MATPTHFHDYVTVVTDIDKKKYGKRVVPCKILMLGLGRTGTFSLITALKSLGFHNAYHGYTCTFDNPRDCEMWLEALEAKFENPDHTKRRYGRREFDQIMGHCQVISDMPATCFTEELIEAYPDAKVILTLRKDVDGWYRSMLNTIDRRVSHPLSRLMGPVANLLRIHSRFVRPAIEKAWHHTYGGGFGENGIATYHAHNALVRALVPKERLLEYHVEEGWDPLCRFLGVERPREEEGVAFPRSNERDVFEKRFRKAFVLTCARCARTVVRGAFGVGIAVLVARWLWERGMAPYICGMVGAACAYGFGFLL